MPSRTEQAVFQTRMGGQNLNPRPPRAGSKCKRSRRPFFVKRDRGIENMGGQEAIRGFLVQTLIGLLDALDNDPPWECLTLEPNVDSEKVDILWVYADGTTKAVQVKSTKNEFRKADLQRWAAELEAWQQADQYELMLAGTPASAAVAKLRVAGKVAIPPAKNNDIPAFREQAAHKLDGFLKKHRLPQRDGDYREMLADALATKLAALSTRGKPLTRAALVRQIKQWVPQSPAATVSGPGPNSVAGPNTVRLIRVFVSSPGDVAEERKALDHVVASINRTDGQTRGVRLELFRWEQDVVPRIGPPPQQVVDDQTPAYDIYIGIMSTRFDTPTGRHGSGTEKEFKDALKNRKVAGMPWIVFYFDAQPQLSADPADVEQYLNVCKFRQRMEKLGLFATYRGVRGNDDAFYEKVSEHLRKVLQLLVPLQASNVPEEKAADPTRYLRDLLENTAWIDVRGLNTGKGKANRFGIEDLFISLTTTGSAVRGNDTQAGVQKGEKKGGRAMPAQEGDVAERWLQADREVPLANSLRSDRLVVVGDPGAGKTTFLRRIAYALCQTELGDDPLAAKERLAIDDRTFPVFVRISELSQHLKRCGDDSSTPKGNTTAAWLPHFLSTTSLEGSCRLDEDYFRQRLEQGECTVLLDGLDEAPDRRLRERVSRLIENVTKAYSGCRFVVTSRPAAYTGEAVLPDFAHARIDPLSDAAVETFLARWCAAIYAQSKAAADSHCAELLASLRARMEIRRMARNPVMLTALAVVHWNERRLPEQRADLYHSIIVWLSRSREQRSERATADRTVVLLQELALAMQNDPEGRRTQVPKRWAAEQLAPEFASGRNNRESIELAERFLEEEELDSGIIVGRGHEVTFWHLTFQEFLAARAIASRLDAEQHRIIFSPTDKVYLPDWREVLLLLAGTLHGQGKAKVDGLVAGMLDRLGPAPSLSNQARCAGVVGAIMRDLTPFKYQVIDHRFHELLDAVMAIFDSARSKTVPVKDRIAAGDALGQTADPRIGTQYGDYWAQIPAGKFLMGAQSKNSGGSNYDNEANDRESPVHEVQLDAFQLARFPVTVGEYAMFIEDDGYTDERWWNEGGFGQFQEPEGWETQVAYRSRPVVGVSWWESAAYCLWAGVRLPTEAEWERAARGTEGRKFPWGSEEPDGSRTNFNRNIGHATPVGIFPLDQTPDGICDMGGNVWEWCRDWYEDYSDGPATNPRGPHVGSSRVIRGGGWFVVSVYCRAACRLWLVPQYRSDYLGFRVAAVPVGGAVEKPERAEPGAKARTKRGGAAK